MEVLPLTAARGAALFCLVRAAFGRRECRDLSAPVLANAGHRRKTKLRETFASRAKVLHKRALDGTPCANADDGGSEARKIFAIGASPRKNIWPNAGEAFGHRRRPSWGKGCRNGLGGLMCRDTASTGFLAAKGTATPPIHIIFSEFFASQLCDGQGRLPRENL